MLEQLLQHPLTEQLGTVLLHSIWQGLMLWLLLILALQLIPARRHSARHALASTVLLIWLVAPLLTLLSLNPAASTLPSPAARIATVQPNTLLTRSGEGATLELHAEAPAISAAATSQVQRPQPDDSNVLPLLALIWIGGASLLSIRYLGGLLSIRSLKRGARPVHQHTVLLRKLAERIGINRPVQLLRSGRTDTPAAFGLLRPVVLLPMSAASGLSTSQLELVLAHELAHIKRHDYLISIIQGLAEALLFYHPLTWTLSRVLLREREHACDVLALQATGAQPIELARTLTQLEGARLDGPALAATGNLKARVQQLLDVPGRKPTTGSAPVLIILTLIAGLLSFAALNAQANEQPAATVVIDPAHSDTFPGATAHGLHEAELNLLIARKVAEQLEGAGVRVLLTRDGNEALAETLADDLAARVSAASGADLLVSLHAGAASNQVVRGIRSYVITDEYAEPSRQLAEAVQQQLSRATGAAAADLIDQPGNRLLNLVDIPAFMLEYGYLSNTQEAELLTSPAYQDQIAAGISAGILNYLAQPQLFTRSPELVVAPDWLDVPVGGWPTFSSLAQLQRAAGAFHTPTRLPDGYFLSNTVIVPETGALHLTWTSRLRTDPDDAPEQTMGFSQVRLAEFTPVNISLGAEIVEVNVDGRQAYFVPGGWRNADGQQAWTDEGGSLVWEQAEQVMQLGINSGNNVLDSLLEAAESLVLIDSTASELPVPAGAVDVPPYRWVTLIGPAAFDQSDWSLTSLAAGSRLVLEEQAPEYHRRLVVTSADDGSLQYDFQEESSEQPFGPAVEAWAQTLLTDVVAGALHEAVNQDGLQSSRRSFGRPHDQLGMHFVRSLPSGWPFLHLGPPEAINSGARASGWTLEQMVQARSHAVIGAGLYEYLLWEYRQYGSRDSVDIGLLNHALTLVSGEEARSELREAYADW